MPDLFTTAQRSTPASLLDGITGRPGFVFHDAHNQQVHCAAPGVLGLIEGRHVIGRWRPRSLAWLDGTHGFFVHLLAESEGDPRSSPLRSSATPSLCPTPTPTGRSASSSRR